jgi:cobalt-zinc-cadmium efflux system protein
MHDHADHSPGHEHAHAHDHEHEHRPHGHGHAHGHGHHHHHHHHHAPSDMGRAFAIGVALNSTIVVVQVIAGFYAGSMALLADAGHNLTDVLALVLAWVATALARRAPAGQRTYGMRKGTILASLANAVILLLTVGGIASESIHRLLAPQAVSTGVVMLTAGLGVVINTATALLFLRDKDHDLNSRGAFLHMAGDAAVSVGVVAGAWIISLTGLTWIDPALGLVIGAVIVWGAWGLLTDSFNLAMDTAPRGVNVSEVRDWLAHLPGVEEVHDLHVWAMSTTETALTAHLIRPANGDADAFLHAACEELANRFRIGHATLQVETDASQACRLAPAEVV